MLACVRVVRFPTSKLVLSERSLLQRLNGREHAGRGEQRVVIVVSVA
jgi:hypothetical protein